MHSQQLAAALGLVIVPAAAVRCGAQTTALRSGVGEGDPSFPLPRSSAPSRAPLLRSTMADRLLSLTSAPSLPDLPLSTLTSALTSRFLPPPSRHRPWLRPCKATSSETGPPPRLPSPPAPSQSGCPPRACAAEGARPCCRGGGGVTTVAATTSALVLEGAEPGRGCSAGQGAERGRGCSGGRGGSRAGAGGAGWWGLSRSRCKARPPAGAGQQRRRSGPLWPGLSSGAWELSKALWAAQ